MKILLKLNFHWPQTVTELLDLLDSKIKTNIHLISINTFLEHTSMQLAKMFEISSFKSGNFVESLSSQ